MLIIDTRDHLVYMCSANERWRYIWRYIVMSSLIAWALVHQMIPETPYIYSMPNRMGVLEFKTYLTVGYFCNTVIVNEYFMFFKFTGPSEMS